MKLTIKILNGKRFGDSFELKPFEASMEPEFFILEDEALELSFYSEKYFDKISILLYESEVNVTRIEETPSGWVYKWIPKKLGRNYYECFFHNFYGIAELSIEVEENKNPHVYSFEPIEVLAKKINAERVEYMLNFLAKNNSDALCSFFRVTRRKAGFKHGDTPAEIILEQLENIVNKTYVLIIKILQNPITKLSNRESYVFPTDSTNIDDITLAWLCDNTDELFETDCMQSAILEHDYKLYGAIKIRENKLTEDTNVYENQIIHGFISTLILSASVLLSGFLIPKKNKTNNTGNIDGYSSFFSQIQKFHANINERKISKCHEILIRLHSIRKAISDNLPATKSITGIPIFTMKAKKNTLYLSLFKKIVDWNRYGKPDWSVQDELFSIKSIPKLFEYYTLFYIKDIMDKKFNFSSETELNSTVISFSYPIEVGLNISLHYEPKYWTVSHANVDLRSLINTEAWTVYNGKVGPRSSTHRHANRSPDYVLTVESENGTEKYYIMDAKYTTSEKAFINYLPELTLKYLHGVHSLNKRMSSITGMLIINPDNTPHAKHFHNKNFDIFSDNPITPYISCVGIAPGEEFKGNIDFESVIKRVIDLLLKELLTQNENTTYKKAMHA